MIQCDEEYMKSVRAFAESRGLTSKLEKTLSYLDGYADHDKNGRTQCRLFKDWAPYSFRFSMMVRKSPESPYEFWFNGGVIFHGQHDGGGSGEAPTFSVSLAGTTDERWEIHT